MSLFEAKLGRNFFNRHSVAQEFLCLFLTLLNQPGLWSIAGDLAKMYL